MQHRGFLPGRFVGQDRGDCRRWETASGTPVATRRAVPATRPAKHLKCDQSHCTVGPAVTSRRLDREHRSIALSVFRCTRIPTSPRGRTAKPDRSSVAGVPLKQSRPRPVVPTHFDQESDGWLARECRSRPAFPIPTAAKPHPRLWFRWAAHGSTRRYTTRTMHDSVVYVLYTTVQCIRCSAASRLVGIRDADPTR